MSIEEFIGKWGEQSADGETGLEKIIAEIQVQIEDRILEDVMAEFNIEKTN